MVVSRSGRVLAMCAAVLAAGAGLCAGQPADTARQPIATDPNASVEAYAEQLGLEDVVVVQLRDRLRATTEPEARIEIAEKLGRVYVKQLTRATSADERRSVQEASRELLEQVPEVDSFDLRLDLAKAVYLRAEEIAERVRLRLDSEGEKQQAEKMLRENLPTFAQLRQRLHRRVETLDTQESRVDDEAAKLIRASLSEAQRQRSLAAYYEGWTRYYIAMLTGQSAEARESLEAFGVVLNAVPGRAPSVERVNNALLQYEHVARAAVGCALALSILGNDVDAVRWLERVDEVDAVPDAVKSQLFSRRLAVLAAAQRWADVESLVRRHRGISREDESNRLSAAEARLLAVLCFDARSANLRPGIAAIAQEMGQVALGDLIAAKELQQVVDLSQRFGTLPLGDEGFVVAYVRGLLGFESARAAHRTQTEPDAPTQDPALMNQYRQAADLFRSALHAKDVVDYPSERSRTQLRLGLALFYAGDVLPAADAFESAVGAIDASVREDATWFGIVSLTRAIEQGATEQQARRDRLAMMHIQSFPRSPNTARLLLQSGGSSMVSDQQRLELLLSVPSSSPVGRSARRAAASLLYVRFRGAAPDQRELVARQFLSIADQVFREEVDDAAGASGEDARRLAEAAVLRGRQVLDVLLGVERPDAERALAMLDSVDRLASSFSLSTQAYQSELRLRRLQLALARDDDTAALAIADELARTDDAYASVGARLLFRRFFAEWETDPANVQLARRVVGFGVRAVEREGTSAFGARMREQLAIVAGALWKGQKDEQMRALSLAMDEELLKQGVQTEAVLRRAAQHAEDGNDARRACELWSVLMQGLTPKTDLWYEARWNSLRLLAIVDPAEAWKAYTQYQALYPEQAPDPWAIRIETVGNSVRPAQTQPPAGNAPGGRKATGGGK